MFDLSLLIRTLTQPVPRPQAGDEPSAVPFLHDRPMRTRPGERMFSDALSGLGQPMNAG